MKRSAYSLLGSVALSLLTGQAFAVKLVSSTVQTGRVEGQSVSVSATVDWETGLTRTSPLDRRIVNATVLTNLGTITSVPLAKSVPMTQDASGNYVGAFSDLPVGNYQISITASHVVTVVGSPNQVTSASVTKGLSVGVPAGCFTFPNHSLQSFSVAGFFNADTNNKIAPQTFFPQWNAFGFLGTSDGSFFLNTDGTQPPPANQTPDSYRFDIVSPDLSTNTSWQGITGLSFRYFIQSGDAFLHAVVRVRNADGSLGLVTQTDSATGIPLMSPGIAGGFETMVEHVQIPAGATVVGADVRVFMDPGAHSPDLLVDLICPRH
jgi:hypothetical protein